MSRLSRRKLLAWLSLGTLAAPVRADLYDDYINSTSKQPFVAFLARRGVPGHAFVGIGVTLEAGLTVYERFLGFYPLLDGTPADAKLVFGQTSGALDFKWHDLAWDEKYVVTVDDSKKAAALAVADTWRQSGSQYNMFAAGGKNCSSFVGEVATSIGLKAPGGAGSMFPADYIRALREANGGG